MNKRQPITKSLRFAVLKRDRFRCKYCGISAEEVDEPLQIDHVKPVSKGGTNDIINLVASCFACNNGKRDELLSENVELELQRKELEQMQAKREQLEMMVEWRDESQNLPNFEIDLVAQYWRQATFGDPHNCCDTMQLKHLIKRFGTNAVCQGIDEVVATYLRDNTRQRHEYGWQKLKRVIEVNEQDKVEPGYKAKTMVKGFMKWNGMLPNWARTIHDRIVEFAIEQLSYNIDNLDEDAKASLVYSEFVDRLLGLPLGTVQSSVGCDVLSQHLFIYKALQDRESELVERVKQHHANKKQSKTKITA